jgi:hypothetical protein
MALSPQAKYTDWATATCRRKLVPTFVDRGVSRGQRGGSPRLLFSVFWTGADNFLSSSSSFILTRAEWTPFQTHCYSENLIAPYSYYSDISSTNDGRSVGIVHLRTKATDVSRKPYITVWLTRQILPISGSKH